MNKVLIFYSGLLVIGGLIGFISAGSMASLIMSTIFAFLILFSLYLENQYLTTGLIAFLTLFFTYRAFQTGKFMPPGMLALITFGVLVMILSRQFASKI